MANVFKFNNEYRMQIIIKYKKEDNLLKVLRELDNIFIMNKDTRLEIDFEPLNIWLTNNKTYYKINVEIGGKYERS